MKNEYFEREEVKLPDSKLKIFNFAKIIGGVLILVLTFEAFGVLLRNLTVKPVVAQWGTIEKGCWTEAIFLRDESVLIAPASGELIMNILDGVRVPNGEVIAAINSIGENTIGPDLSLQARLQILTREVQLLQVDFERIKKEIANNQSKLNDAPKNSVQARILKEDLISLEQEKERVFRNIQRNRIETQQIGKEIVNWPGGTILIHADTPGYLFSKYDQWETKLNSDHFSELTPADFKRTYPLKSIGNYIKTGEIIGKIINPFKQIIAITINTNQTGIPDKGDIWWFKVGDNLIKSTVWGRIPLADDKMILAVEDTMIPPELMPNRRAKIFMVFRRISGVCVPIQALFKKGGDTIVKVVKGDGSKEEKVSVIETDDVKAIIEGIEFGTTIISR